MRKWVINFKDGRTKGHTIVEADTYTICAGWITLYKKNGWVMRKVGSYSESDVMDIHEDHTDTLCKKL